jgi:hypothetical protein
MICPVCKQPGARRSRRHSLADYIVSVMGIFPWRCNECHARFHARLMPLVDTFYAHCPHCGNTDLKRISPEYVGSRLASIWGVLRIPSYRCEPCRHKYFSVLPMRRTRRSLQPSSVEGPTGKC